MEKHAKLLGQFSPEAHFSKMIHTGKKSISLSSDEPSVGFHKEAMGEGGGRGHTQSHVRVLTHTQDGKQPSLQILRSLWN